MTGKPYQPRPHIAKAFDEFEELIGMPLRRWLFQHTQEGYSVRWMADKIGVSTRPVQRLLKVWEIRPVHRHRGLRPHRPNGPLGYALMARLRMDGYPDRNLYDRVHLRVMRGTPYPVALQQALQVKPRNYTR
jgi:hypothetical protein